MHFILHSPTVLVLDLTFLTSILSSLLGPSHLGASVVVVAVVVVVVGISTVVVVGSGGSVSFSSSEQDPI